MIFGRRRTVAAVAFMACTCGSPLPAASASCLFASEVLHNESPLETTHVRNCRGNAIENCSNRNRLLSIGFCECIDLSTVRSQNFLWACGCSSWVALDRLSSERMVSADHRTQRHYYLWLSRRPIAHADVSSTVAEGNQSSYLKFRLRSVIEAGA
jgi:hypothetical protein